MVKPTTPLPSASFTCRFAVQVLPTLLLPPGSTAGFPPTVQFTANQCNCSFDVKVRCTVSPFVAIDGLLERVDARVTGLRTGGVVSEGDVITSGFCTVTPDPFVVVETIVP